MADPTGVEYASTIQAYQVTADMTILIRYSLATFLSWRP
jgi:hypothetical protein